MTRHLLTALLLVSVTVLPVRADFSFYGHKVSSDLHVSGIRFTSKLSQSGINYLNNRIPEQRVNDLTNQIIRAKTAYALDDVGTILFAHKASRAASSHDYTSQLMEYRALSKLGYDVILSYTDYEMMVFGRLDQVPAASVYLFYQNKRYTNLDFHDKKTVGQRRIFTLSTNQRSVPIRITRQTNPRLSAKLVKRIVLWEHMGKMYRIDAVTNMSLTEYLQDIPVMEIGKSYVNRGCSPQFEESVVSALRKELEAFESPSDKAEFLLAFVQKAFRYQTDEEQFGHEKYNYPEETLLYTYSDCEDRTLLLAFLYKRLLNLNSVAMYFQNDKHISLAVALPDHSNDYSFQYKGVKYVACEPTGIGFHLGDMGLSLERITEVIEL
ncbi:MAG: hypothetical protein H6608_12835 [Flavobacteriales bacterium]|nr:hypothetical protein [Flavobacteriales bacterium]